MRGHDNIAIFALWSFFATEVALGRLLGKADVSLKLEFEVSSNTSEECFSFFPYAPYDGELYVKITFFDFTIDRALYL